MHSYNHGLVTSAKGMAIEHFAFAVGATGAVGTILQHSSNVVASVTRTGAGAYTVQLNKPYPPRLVDCVVNVHVAGPTVPLHAFYVRDSYNASTGSFSIGMGDADTPAATDPANGDDVGVTMYFDRYTRT